ncbi:hypothetical protein DFS34DRAFT_160577 [Phlyctochytrium arcticum]|nr:hypothetical protein DFS34DRAFT_160577 [Phlyctochytrium arcticum]
MVRQFDSKIGREEAQLAKSSGCSIYRRFDCLWIEDAAKSSDQQVFSREHLNCLLALVTAVDNAEFKSPESWNVPDKVRASTGRNLLRLFLRQEFEESSAPVGSQRISAALLGRLTQQISEDVLFEEDPSREKLYELLFAPHEDVQRCAFSLLRRLTAIFIQTTSLQVELNASKQILPPLDQPSAEDETSPDNIPAPVVAEKPVEEVREEKFPEPLALATSRVVPEHDHEPQDRQTTHANQLLGYLLSWMLLFDHFEDATFDLKSNYVSHLRQLETLPTLMQHCFVILGVGWSRAPFDLTKWDVRDYDVAGFEISSKVAFPLLAAHLYWRALRYTPSLVRNWWSECKNRQLTIAVDT